MKHFFLLFLLFVPIHSLAAEVSTQVDRNPVPVNESFHVIYETEGTVKQQPDFTPLEKDFEIRGNSRSSQINIVNGQYNATTRWTLELMAHRSGAATLPALRFGDATSQPVTISIVDAPAADGSSGSEDIFLEVEATPRDPYVQAQVLYTIRLYRAVSTRNASLSEPRSLSGQVVVKKLGEDLSFEKVRNGRRYRVVERKYALFPQQSGALSVSPVIFEGEVGGGARFSFDPFARGARVVRHRSEAVDLEVRPIPAAFSGEHWLPARGLELEAAWPSDPPELTAGEPVTRTLAVIADGLTAGQLPEVAGAAPPRFKQYPDKPELLDDTDPQGIVGTRRERIAMIPTRQGLQTLPGITLPWWNTETDREEQAHLAPRTVTVAPGNPIPPTADPSTSGIDDLAKMSAVTAIEPQTHGNPVTGSAQSTTQWGWMLSSLILGLAWLATLLLWWRSRRDKTEKSGGRHSSTGVRAARRRLHKACMSGDPDAAAAALRDWSVTQLPDTPPISLQELGTRAGGDLRTQVTALQAALYAPQPQPWDGKALWSAAITAAPRLRGEKTSPTAPGLEPLYRI